MRRRQSRSVFTVALREVAAGWSVTARAWAKGTQSDVINQGNP